MLGLVGEGFHLHFIDYLLLEIASSHIQVMVGLPWNHFTVQNEESVLIVNPSLVLVRRRDPRIQSLLVSPRVGMQPILFLVCEWPLNFCSPHFTRYLVVLIGESACRMERVISCEAISTLNSRGGKGLESSFSLVFPALQHVFHAFFPARAES